MAELPRYISNTHVVEVCEHHPKMMASTARLLFIPFGILVASLGIYLLYFPSLAMWGSFLLIVGVVTFFFGFFSSMVCSEDAKKSGRCEKYSILDLFDFYIRKKKFKRLLQLKDEANQYNNLCDMIYTIWEMGSHKSGEKKRQFTKSCKIMHSWRERLLLQFAADKAQRETKGDVFKLPDGTGDIGLGSLVKANEENTELEQIVKELEKDTGGSI